MNLDEFKSKGKERPYDYYKAINPELTKVMYDYLRGNGSLWKVKCGKEVHIKWSIEPPLKRIWWRDTPECFCTRYKNYYDDDNDDTADEVVQN